MEWELNPLDDSRLDQVAELYARVFAGKPWYEVSRCNVCGIFSGTPPDLEIICGCDKKGKYSTEAYPLEETREYILEELGHTNSVGLIAVAGLAPGDAGVIGFAWGYGWTRLEMSEAKWKSPDMRRLVNDRVKEDSFFYVSEVGVLEPYQGRKIGRRLTNELAGRGKDTHQGKTVLRTNENSPMRYLAEKLGLEPVIGLNNGFIDTENPQRVLFEGMVK